MQLPNAREMFVGKYQLERVLGEGGFARVFLATETSLGRTVALKVLKPKDEGYPPGTRARFEREVKIIANLTDPHTITVFDWGATDGGLLYMVFEYIDGRDLVEILHTDGPLAEPDAIHVLEQVLQSLREAHASHLLHRDIKPHNIRIYEYAGDRFCAKLLDFGIAKPVHDPSAAITAEGVLIGSPRYMSPEQLFEHVLTPASDLYSVGLVTFEMLMGRDALPGSALNDQLKRLSGEAPVVLPADAPVSPRMREIVGRLLAHDKQARFSSADEVLAALAETRTEPLRAPPMPAPPVVPRPVTLEERSATLEERPPTQAVVPVTDAGTKVMNLALGGLAVAALIGVGTFLFQYLTAETAPPSSPSVRTILRSAPPRAATPRGSSSSPGADLGVDIGPSVMDGCGQDPPFQGRGAMSELAGLDHLSWLVFVPKGYDPAVRHQVLMLFHEDLESPAFTLDLTGFERFAEERNIVVILPRDRSIRAWRGLDEMWMAKTIFEITAERLCLDEGVLAFGHGTGGRAVERLHCVMPVKAAATSAHRPEIEDSDCEPIAPEPYLHIAPLSDGYDPVKGGVGCGGAKVSLDDFEQRWRRRNHCTEKRTSTGHPGGTCTSWDCEAPFVSCHAKGGHRWPGQKRRGADLQGCDGKAMTLPISEIVWEFFDSVSG